MYNSIKVLFPHLLIPVITFINSLSLNFFKIFQIFLKIASFVRKYTSRHKQNIAVATALAGEMLGLKMLYLEGGSGANMCVNPEIISRVKKACTIPIIVGGGIRTTETLQQIYDCGADIAVIGTIIEKQPDLLHNMMEIVRKLRVKS